ncbi:uncharacterized protein F4807DRAFT_456654 [Annulohypoxylon truncatum]|uniref:uncharacterized protein n=1 Tax=Annulohypoxylon truncatum TaxID=327061 RepID=UPI00200750C9|nr:uncharacterized protein F4807DRAFT_456654 [Annulohypoxylon truncatum]KAI1213312.1 hypothetical protein F4807DRAFT_456654 [Annulohypoxylon truncatum]
MSTAKPIGPLRKAWYQWKAIRFPWRKRYLVGLDLQGNTYWEFRLHRGDPSTPDSRFRRIVQYPRSTHLSEIKVSPQWHQWLRYQRREAPTLDEQAQDLVRVEQMKVLAAQADARWEAKPSYLDAPGKEKGQPVPPFDTGRNQPQEQAAREQSAAAAKNGRDSSSKAAQQQKDDPWKRAARSTGPGETWQPEAWTPTSTRKR